MKFLVYSHSSYFDCLDICIGEMVNYGISDITILCDIPYRNYTTIQYDNSHSYSDRLLSCLKQVREEKFVFLHEDFILYSRPDFAKLENITQLSFDSLRLIRSGVSDLRFKVEENIYKIVNHSDFHFAVQASIFSRKYLIKLLESYPGLNIWELEVESQVVARDYNNLVYYDDTPLRGLYHYDSTIFPYVATAINKGKWSSEYYLELSKLHKEYGIDSNIRGWT